ncbi:hypothetical protein GCM10023330_09710 [Litoribaculum gwangyangense]|uniref:DUF547 domain-containing protein n=1 Tax=Litoribaculum gwangyangense TaxID=1130722 RepID=A0ABP9C5E1_9FLAO
MIIFLASCSGTKRIVENDTRKTIEPIKTEKDNIFIQTQPITPDTVEIKNDKIVDEKSQEFGQILSKRFMPIHQLWDELLQKHVSDNGHVNYKTFKTEHKKLLDYIYVLSLMHKSDKFESFPKDEKLAFWINAYNAMTIDLILRHYPLKSIKDIKNPWEQRYWKLGEKWYNLSEIEHQILRKMNEPRIHFAIVCASFSCPKLQNEAFTSERLESQLTDVTKEFLNDPKRNSISENSLELSKIFQWFSKDFKQNGSVIDFINQYSRIKISENAKIKYKDYNWAINE